MFRYKFTGKKTEEVTIPNVGIVKGGETFESEIELLHPQLKPLKSDDSKDNKSDNSEESAE